MIQVPFLKAGLTIIDVYLYGEISYNRLGYLSTTVENLMLS